MWMMGAIDGTLASPERERFADHLGTCPHCRAEWEALNSVERMLDLCFALLDGASILPYYFYMPDMIPFAEH
jgi:anti-sigma factor RsiW